MKYLLFTVLGLLALAGIGASLRPKAIPVETGRVERGALTVTVDGMGKTRFPDRQTIYAPVAGELVKITLRAGDSIQEGQGLAEILPGVSQPLDARTRAELQARLGAARAAQGEARRNVDRAEIALDLAKKEAERARTLAESRSIRERDLDMVEAEEKARQAELALAKLSVERAHKEVQAIGAMLGEPRGPKEERRMVLQAPQGGTVLRIHAESAGPVQPGTPLMDIGSRDRLEIVVELPTQSAMRISKGAAVRVQGLGNSEALSGVVRLIEPAAFTKITALGVEEQRVHVLVDLEGDAADSANVGDGFAVETHIVVHEAENVLRVPSGAVFRHGGGHAVFGVSSGKALLFPVEVGQRSATHVEIRTGLEEGMKVIVHPSDKIANGTVVVEE
jgi:HlyD family secretion protein